MFKKLLSYFTLYCVIITQTASLAFAQLSITPDGSTSTQVTHTASGIDQVNIAAPNASGISHNNFTDYNVNQSGQVINNFSGQVASEVAGGSGVTAVTQTQIGGLVTVNQNLSSSGSARIILNEVTSTNNSQLLGYAEIAGTKAELIIANPNGITCSGCGFINTSRLSLIAGTSAYDPSGNLNFNLKEPVNLQIPLITIQGLGLDVERTSYTDIIASSIKLIGNIYGSDNTDVTLKAADGKFDYATKNITNSTAQNSELFAIDATNLGGIQAGRIFIIATKDGFGVNLDNSLIASKEMQIDVRGNIFYTNIQAPTASLKSTKNITHKENGIMLANSVNIEARDFTTNSGALTKSLLDDINISARNFSNSGNIISAKNLNIGATSLTNYGILNAAEKITITASEDILNEGIIGSFAVQNPDSSFTNFITKEIQITARNLNNKNLIYANDDISFTLTNFLTNSANIISAKDLRATAKNFKNDSGLIQATRNLSITKSGAAEIGATSFSNNDGNFLSGSSFDINFGANDYIINGTISSDEITISAANIINNSDVEASTSITLSATNDITNNSGASFVAGSFFDATATNDITNYGLISATTDTNLTAKNLNNFDRIFAGSNLETAITNNLTNNTNSLIGAGNNLTLKVDNNLLNDRGASILAIADIEIKSNAGGKISNFTNNSALLESIEGDIVINAVDFYNKRDAQDFGVMEIVKTDANKTWYENEQKYYEGGIYGSGPIYGGGGPGWSGVRLENLGLHYTIWDHAWNVARYDSYIDQITQTRRTEGIENKSSMIRAAGDITINATNFNNHSSEIISLNDLTVNAVNFNNKSQGIMDTIRHYCGAGAGSCTAYKIITDPNSGVISYQLVASLGWNVWYPDSYYEFDAIGSFFTAALKAKNNLNLNVSNIINNGQAQGTQTVDHNLPTTQTEFTQDSAYVSPVITQLKETGSLNILGNVTKTATALFNKSTNPNVPLYETRAEFIDQNQFLGSDYFFNAIGYSPPATSRLIGDNFFMQKLIESQLNDILKTSTALSSSSFALYSDNIQELMDNAAQMKQDLSLAPGISLSAASIAALTKDIVWIEAVTLADGTVVLAPKVYLSQATRDQLKLNEGEILGAKNINITGNSASTILNNSGSIVASNNLSITGISALNNQGRSTYNRNSLIESGNNLTLSTNNNLLNFGTIKATGATSNLTLTSLNGNITNNNSSTINSTNALTINALNGTLLNKSAIEASGALAINARDIKNISTVYTNDANLLEENSDAYQLRFDSESGVSSGNIYSVLHETASMKGGSVALSATNDFTNLGAEISATKNNVGGALTSGNVSITAGDDINFDTVQLRNRSEISWGSGRNHGTTITDTTKNIASTVSAAGSITLTSTGLGNDVEGTQTINLYNQKTAEITPLQNQITQLQSQLANTSGKERNDLNNQISSLQNQINSISANYDNQISDLALNAGSNINIIGSNLTAADNLTLDATTNINIMNAVDSSYYSRESTKKGSVKISKSVQVDYVESAKESSLNANNINLTAGNNVFLQAANLNSDNNTEIHSTNTTIQNATLNEYHYAHTSRSYHGVAKVGANIVSTVMGLTDLGINLFFTTTLEGQMLKRAGGKTGDLVGRYNDSREDAKSSSIYNIKHKTFETSNSTNVFASNLNIGNNLDITADEDVLIQASNIRTGLSDTTPDKSDAAIEGKLTINADNLHITAAQETEISTYEDKKTRTLQFNNWNEGNVGGNVVNSTIESKNDGFIFNANNFTASYKAEDFDSTTGTLNQNATGLNYLTYLHQNKDDVLYNPVTQIQKEWADANRGLTAAGTALIAIAAIVATILTAGALAPVTAAAVSAGTFSAATVGFVGGVAIASSAASTFTISATNTSMNVDGDVFKQAKDINKQAAKDTTSKESLRNMAIAGTTAVLTFGIAHGISELSNSAEAANSASNTSQLPTSVDSSYTNLSYNTDGLTVGNSGSFTSGSNAVGNVNSTALSSRFLTALQNSAIQSVASSAAQSAVNGDSFSDALKNSAKNLIINAAGQVLANEIGNLYHGNTDSQGYVLNSSGDRVTYFGNEVTQISKPLQLTLHGILGCGMAAAGGSDCGAGAAAGIVGESVGEWVYNNGNGLNKQQAIAAGQLSGALTTVMVVGSDDGNSVFAGSQIGRNALENNAYFANRPLGPLPWMGVLSNNKWSDNKNLEISHEQLFFEDELGGNIGFLGPNNIGPDDPSLLNSYRITRAGFDDGIMREAVANVKVGSYNLLRCNCQDWASTVREEYYRIVQKQNERNLLEQIRQR